MDSIGPITGIKYGPYLAFLDISESVFTLIPFITGMAHEATGWNIITPDLNRTRKQNSTAVQLCLYSIHNKSG